MIIRSTLLKEKKKRKYYVKSWQEEGEDENMKVKKNEMNEWKECIMGLNIYLSIQLVFSPKSYTLHHVQQQQQQAPLKDKVYMYQEIHREFVYKPYRCLIGAPQVTQYRIIQ